MQVACPSCANVLTVPPEKALIGPPLALRALAP